MSREVKSSQVGSFNNTAMERKIALLEQRLVVLERFVETRFCGSFRDFRKRKLTPLPDDLTRQVRNTISKPRPGPKSSKRKRIVNIIRPPDSVEEAHSTQPAKTPDDSEEDDESPQSQNCELPVNIKAETFDSDEESSGENDHDNMNFMEQDSSDEDKNDPLGMDLDEDSLEYCGYKNEKSANLKRRNFGYKSVKNVSGQREIVKGTVVPSKGRLKEKKLAQSSSATSSQFQQSRLSFPQIAKSTLTTPESSHAMSSKIQRSSGRAKDPIWSEFTCVDPENKTFSCNHCKKLFRFPQPDRLRKHIGKCKAVH